MKKLFLLFIMLLNLSTQECNAMFKNVYQRTRFDGNKSLEDLLHAAVHYDDSSKVEALLNAGARPSGEHMRLAASFGYEAPALLLIQHGADIHSQDHGGKTALHSAAGQCLTKLSWELLERGADPNASDNGTTPLHQLASIGHLNKSIFFASANQDYCARLLLKAGAHPNTRGKRGATALYIASEVGNAQLCRTLQEFGADLRIIDVQGHCPLQVVGRRYEGQPDVSIDKQAIIKALICSANFSPYCSIEELRTAQRRTRLALFNLNHICPRLPIDVKHRIFMLDPELRADALKTLLKWHNRSYALSAHMPLPILKGLIKYGSMNLESCVAILKKHTLEKLDKFIDDAQLEENYGAEIESNIHNRLSPGIVARVAENCSVQ